MPVTSRYRIEGMHCASCVARLESALRKLPGVQNVAVNLATHEACIVHDTSTLDISSAVEGLGYRAYCLDGASDVSQTALANESDIAREWQTAGLLTVCVLLITGLSFVSAEFLVREIFLFALTAIVLTVAGREFFHRAAVSIWHARLDMDVLIALGAGTAFGSGTWTLAQSSRHWLHTSADDSIAACGSEFLAATLIVYFVWIGRRLEARARRKASQAIERLLDLQSPTARVLQTSGLGTDFFSEVESEVPVERVAVGDVVLVRSGERVPVDGVVTAGVTEIDESSFTGESLPVRKQPGDNVLGGSINQSGSFRFLAVHVGEEMVLRRIVALVRDAQGSKAPIARLADRVARVFVPIVLAIAWMTLFWWMTYADAQTATSRMVAVLVVACPCALGLATPTAVMIAMGRSAELGVLFKDGAALEQTASLQIALFDKTGTLTEGRPEIVEVVPANGVSRDELLKVSATIASGSNHPLARAVVMLAQQESIAFDVASSGVHSEPGLGLRAESGGETVLFGSWRWMQHRKMDGSAGHAQATTNDDQEVTPSKVLGRTQLFIARGGRIMGMLAAEDRIRVTAGEATLALRSLHIETGLVSGDRFAVVKHVAHKLGISLIEAERLPNEKVDVVRSLQSTGRRVAMIGDGVNDAPALAAADVGFAIGAGADIAIEAADVTLVGSDPRAVAHAIELARRTLRIIRQNLFFAFAYNLISIPLAAGLLSAFGPIILPPGFAAAAMSASSVLVVTNSLRMKRFRPNN